jgi:hypothetical protein
LRYFCGISAKIEGRQIQQRYPILQLAEIGERLLSRMSFSIRKVTKGLRCALAWLR